MRVGDYWRLENLKSVDEFLKKPFRSRVTSLAEFAKALREGFENAGPTRIEVPL